MVDRGVQQRPGEGHEQGRGDALAGHVGDDDTEWPAASAQPEQVEEVAADLAGRLVVAGDFEPGHLGRDQRHEAALESPAVRQLLVEPTGVGGMACGRLGIGASETRPRGPPPTNSATARPTSDVGVLAPRSDPDQPASAPPMIPRLTRISRRGRR